MKLTKTQREKISDIGKKYRLGLIILHGSYATGKIRPNSDLDIGILGKKPIGNKKFDNIFAELEKIFGNNKGRELDVKSLHRIDPLFRYQVARDSQLIFGDQTTYNEFRAYAFQSYYDSASLFKLEELLIKKYQGFLNRKYQKRYA